MKRGLESESMDDRKARIARLLKNADFSKLTLNQLTTIINLFDLLGVPMKEPKKKKKA